jgi:hypothetical protein
MPVLALIFSALAMLFGLRLIITALQTAFTGKVLVRQGVRFRWQPAPDRDAAWRIAFRDGLTGVLLIVLGIAFFV